MSKAMMDDARWIEWKKRAMRVQGAHEKLEKIIERIDFLGAQIYRLQNEVNAKEER